MKYRIVIELETSNDLWVNTFLKEDIQAQLTDAGIIRSLSVDKVPVEKNTDSLEWVEP